MTMVKSLSDGLSARPSCGTLSVLSQFPVLCSPLYSRVSTNEPEHQPSLGSQPANFEFSLVAALAVVGPGHPPTSSVVP